MTDRTTSTSAGIWLFVSYLPQVDGFRWVLRFSPRLKLPFNPDPHTHRHDMTLTLCFMTDFLNPVSSEAICEASPECIVGPGGQTSGIEIWGPCIYGIHS